MGFFDFLIKGHVRPEKMYPVTVFLDLISECRNEYACFEFVEDMRYRRATSRKISCEEGPLIVYWRVSYLEDEFSGIDLCLSDTLAIWSSKQKRHYQGYFQITTFGDLYDGICDILESYPDKSPDNFDFNYWYDPARHTHGYSVYIDTPSDLQLEWQDFGPVLVACNVSSLAMRFGGC